MTDTLYECGDFASWKACTLQFKTNPTPQLVRGPRTHQEQCVMLASARVSHTSTRTRTTSLQQMLALMTNRRASRRNRARSPLSTMANARMSPGQASEVNINGRGPNRWRRTRAWKRSMRRVICEGGIYDAAATIGICERASVAPDVK